MIEGLWTVTFALPPGMVSEYDLNGGVAVIETGRLLGGDSGYYYVGDVNQSATGTWQITVSVTRHDPNIISLFGDLDQFALSGMVNSQGSDALGRTTLTVVFPMAQGPALTVQLTKVAELP